MSSLYGNIRTETVLREKGRVPNYILLRDWAVTLSRRPSKFNEKTKTEIENQLYDAARQVEEIERQQAEGEGIGILNACTYRYRADNAQFSQFSITEAADALFNGSKTAAKRAVDKCLADRLLYAFIHGRKGFSTVYLIPPLEFIHKSNEFGYWVDIDESGGLMLTENLPHRIEAE